MRIATRVGRNTSMSFGWPVAAIYALIALFVFIAECLAAFAAGCPTT